MRSFLYKLFGVLKYLVPLMYLAGAALVWELFAEANPDGLANIWIVLYTLPVFAIGTILLHQQFPYMPGGYYQAHAMYFFPSVALLATLSALVFHGLQMTVRPRAKATQRDEAEQAPSL